MSEDEYLLDIVERASKEDILILKALEILKTRNSMMSVGKRKIMREAANLTDYKFTSHIQGLYLAGFVGVNRAKRESSYYITNRGRKFLDLCVKYLRG